MKGMERVPGRCSILQQYKQRKSERELKAADEPLKASKV